MWDTLEELKAEHDELDALLSGLTDDQWSARTTAEGWDVRDQVSHLADTNEICIDTIAGGARPLNEFARSFSSPEEFTHSGVERGRAMAPADVLTWWRDSARANRDALEAKDPKERVPWGLGMSARMMATARQMEHWAHGAHDVRTALGLEPRATPRLRSVSFLTLKAVPYALAFAQVSSPPGSLRAELDFEGETWRLGPDDADNVIAGDALAFCILGIRRITRDQTTLKADGPLAEAALDNLRAFL